MTEYEKLLQINFRQRMDMARAAAGLAYAADHLARAQTVIDGKDREIQRLTGEIECLKLDLAEARAGRSVRQ